MAKSAAQRSGSSPKPAKAKAKAGGRAEAGSAERTVATNRRARREYEILDTLEAGIVLVGPEVKSLREGRANIGDAYALVRRGEVWLQNLHVSPYEPATRENPDDPQRERKLLLHRHQIAKLESRVNERGLTIIPLRIYFSGGRVKVELALARGKHVWDKREDIKRRDDERETRRAFRDRGREGS